MLKKSSVSLIFTGGNNKTVRRYSLRLASEQKLPKLASSFWWNLEVIVRPSIAADDDKSELGIVSIRGLSDRTWKTLVGVASGSLSTSMRRSLHEEGFATYSAGK